MNTKKTEYEQALDLWKQGKDDQAKNILTQLLVTEPENAIALTLLGNIYFRNNETNGAIQHWNRAMSVDPDFVDPLVNLGVANSFSNPELALSYFEETLNKAPDRIDAIHNRTDLLQRLGRVEEAIVHLASAMRIRPLLPDVFLLAAQLEAKRNNTHAAENYLRQLLEEIPDQTEALVNLGQLRWQLGNYQEAKALLEKALKKDPDNFFTNGVYGQFLSEQGYPQASLTYLQKATSIQPDNWGIHVHFGNALKEVGQVEIAIQHYQQALRLNPGDLGTRQNLSRLLARFVPPWHFRMLADKERNELFAKAIKKYVKAGSVVFDIGTGSGLLSMVAARAGAHKVYTCEQSPYIAETASDIFKTNELNELITLFPTKSTNLTREDIPNPPNLLVAEIFDAGLIGEGAIPTLRHALKNLCVPNCKVIPRAATISAALIQIEGLGEVHPIKELMGFNLSPFDRFRIPREYISEDLNRTQHVFISEPIDILDYDFETLNHSRPLTNPIKQSLKIPISNDGRWDAVGFWFKLDLGHGIFLDSSPKRLNNHWGQALYFLPENIKVQKGDSAIFDLLYSDSNIWFESFTIRA